MLSSVNVQSSSSVNAPSSLNPLFLNIFHILALSSYKPSHRDHLGALIPILAMFRGRPTSRFRVTASFRRFQSGFYHLENASKTMEGIVRRAPKRSQGVYSMRAICLPRLKSVREAGAEKSRGQHDRHIQTCIHTYIHPYGIIEETRRNP